METPGPHSVANREPPEEVLPIVEESDESNEPPTSNNSSKWASMPADMQRKARHKLGDARSVIWDAHRVEASSTSMQDRVFASIFKQMFPQDVPPEEETNKATKGTPKHAQKPKFSLPIMSQNFRKLNARIGVVFVGQARAARLFSWKQPTQTLSFLAVYSFCCLDPNLLAIVPLGLCLLFIMVPAFTTRHPPPPNSLSTDVYEISGPASARPPEIKPAPEMSRDFFRNMRDLQNSMGDYVQLHDLLVDNMNPVTNFANESLSSTVFLAIFSASAIMFVASNLIPWRFVFLVLGWVAIGSMHPRMVRFIKSIDRRPIKRGIKTAKGAFQRWVTNDIVLDGTPEKREVEIFELQRRNNEAWEPWIYAVSPYTPRSPLRVSGDRPRGTRYFEDVQPPQGWTWSSKKWALDMLSRDWVEERMITGVEVEMEGERWVYDIPDAVESASEARKAKAGKNAKKDWEEGTGLEAKGEWRRRRWVRRVQRTIAKADEGSVF